VVKITRLFFVLALLLGSVRLAAGATEVIPPPPEQYFNDYSNVVPQAKAEQLNKELEAFEQQTSNQILVAVFPKMQSDSSIDDYSYHVFQAWRVGQKIKNNGAVLFVFIQDHKCFIEVGSGLEGALPDATAKRIIDTEITPRFKQGDYVGGLSAGIDAIMAATKGEYQGNGRTDADNSNSWDGVIFLGIFILIFGLGFVARIRQGYQSAVYSNGGHSSGIGWLWLISSLFSGGGGGGGWSGGGGGGSFGGGGGFSGGGGSSGGGGAGGSW
jgi:uncharacterized protein